MPSLFRLADLWRAKKTRKKRKSWVRRGKKKRKTRRRRKGRKHKQDNKVLERGKRGRKITRKLIEIEFAVIKKRKKERKVQSIASNEKEKKKEG